MTVSSASDPDLAQRARHLHESGDLVAAGSLYRSILSAHPQDPDALWRLGDIAHRLGMTDQAWPLVEASLRADPQGSAAWNCRGVLLATGGKIAEASEAFARASALAPSNTAALLNLGKAHLALGRACEAARAHRHCIALEPALAAHRIALGHALLAQKRLAEARAEFERAQELAPGDAAAALGLGLALAAQRRYSEAAHRFARAAALEPTLFEARFNLGLAHYQAGRFAPALAALRAAVACDPTHATAHANLIFAMQLDPDSDVASELAERRLWQARHAGADVATPPHANTPDPERVLRVGYVSGDFKAHSASEIFGSVLLNHTPRIEMVCYSQTRDPDHVTALYRDAAHLWRDAARWSDAELAARIRADRIDILVDLSGFTQDSRLPVFARKPAPIQIQAWGHPFGSGLAAMDYVLLDAVVAPEDQRRFFAETVHHLPCCLVFSPPAGAPPVTPLPLEANGFVTFGSFNRLAKVSEAALRRWAEILQRLPHARLLAKDPAFDDEGARHWFLEALRALGIAADRVALRGKTGQLAHFAAYGEVDIALDPIPNAGGATTFGCLWMGIPVITLRDRRPSGRVSASLLSAMGLGELAAADEAGFVETAVALAQDGARLRALRRGLRDRARASVLCDHRAYTDAVESAYRTFWRRWCRTRSAPGDLAC